jgi:hypothetical protein
VDMKPCAAALLAMLAVVMLTLGYVLRVFGW